MPDTSEDLLPLGEYEEHRRKLAEERKKEYNDILRQVSLHSVLAVAPYLLICLQ